MKVAVITPYYKEHISLLKRCAASIHSNNNEVTHIFICDGSVPYKEIDSWTNSQHILLSINHNDAGATPRAIGAMSAFSQGFDAVTFLDADNFYELNHIDKVVELQQQRQTDVVASTRNICRIDGEVLYVDTTESDGIEFCDTNCMFLMKSTLPYLHGWIAEHNFRQVSDFQFWSVLKKSNLKLSVLFQPTVNYCSNWTLHYLQAGVEPPPNSVSFEIDNAGNAIYKKYKTED